MIDVHKKRTYRDFICGYGAACVEMLVTYPLSKISFRQQIHNINLIAALGRLKSEGVRFVYRGLLPPMCQKTTARALMFGMYDRITISAGCRTDKYFTGCHAMAAFLAGSVEALLVPFERVQVLMQCEQYHHRFKNTFHAFREVKSYGIRECYRGLTPILLRNGPCNVLFFGFRQPLHDFFISIALFLGYYPSEERNHFVEWLCHFIAGAMLGASISTLIFPLNTVKSHMQSKLGGPFESPSTVFKDLLAKRQYRISALFRGAHVNYTRSLIAWGITNSVYELLKAAVFPDD